MSSSLYAWGTIPASHPLFVKSNNNSSSGFSIAKLSVPGSGVAPVMSLAAGDEHIVCVTNDFTLSGAGSNDAGQLLPTKRESKNLPMPKLLLLDLNEKAKVVQVSCGAKFTAYLTQQGRCYTFGDNTFGQLGHSKDREPSFVQPRMVQGIPHEVCVKVCTGRFSTYVLTKHGKVYSCGLGKNGRLGTCNKPKEYMLQPDIKFISQMAGSVRTNVETNCFEMRQVGGALAGNPIMFLDAGEAHVLAVTITGRVYGWGSNGFGQLGFKNIVGNLAVDDGIPFPVLLSVDGIDECSAGSQHSLFVSTNRDQLFGCGSNVEGQLGMKSHPTSTFTDIIPINISLTKGDKIVQTSSGNQVSTVLLSSGELLILGKQDLSGGLAKSPLVCTPIGVNISKISSKESGSGIVDVLASNGLMLAVTSALPSPAILEEKIAQRMFLRDVYPIGATESTVIEAGKKKQFFQELRRVIFDVHTLNASFVDYNVISEQPNRLQSSGVDVEGMLKAMEYFAKMIDEKREKMKIRQLLTAVVAKLNDAAPQMTEPDQLRAYFILAINPLLQQFSPREHELLLTAFFKLPATSRRMLLSWIYHDIGSRKIAYVVDLLVKPMLAKLDQHIVYRKYTSQAVHLCKFLNVLYLMCKHPDITANQMEVPSSAFYTKVLDTFTREETQMMYQKWKAILNKGGPSLNGRRMIARPGGMGMGGFAGLLAPLLFGGAQMAFDDNIDEEDNVNDVTAAPKKAELEETSKRLPTYGLDMFGNEMLRVLDSEDVEKLNDIAPEFVMFQHPFLLSANMKRRFMQIDDASTQQYQFMLHAGTNENPNFILEVRRGEKMFDDTVSELDKIISTDKAKYLLRRILRVKFTDEEGLDGGGVKKEFFLLLSAEMFNPSSGNFKEVEHSSHTIWFNNALETTSADNNKTIKYDEYISRVKNVQNYELNIFKIIGVLMGLAVYNDTLIDVHFPPTMYRMLLKDFDPDSLNMQDFKQFNPKAAAQLEEVLAASAEDLEALMLSFEYTQTHNNFATSIEMVKNGSQIDVNMANREDYVARYIKFQMYSPLIKLKADALVEGFNLVIASSHAAFKLFNADELELLLCGTPELDISKLKENCEYDGGYNPEHKIIKWFWNIVEGFDYDQRTKLLKFSTGSSRAPVGGLKNVKYKIQRAGPDSHQLPTSHTCFNTLLLPDYASKEKLERLLLLAIENSEGFGLQ